MSILDTIVGTTPHAPDRNLLHTPDQPSTYGKGRVVSFDPRDKEFAMRSAIAPFQVTRDKWFWGTPSVPNQGSTSQCVSYSTQSWLQSEPVKNKPYLGYEKFYKLCQLNDEWQGENYNGTSVRASMKILQAAGLISEYLWAFDADTVRRWVLMKSPVVVGTNWYTDMYNVNKFTGFIRPTGRPDGGHAYMLRGADDTIKCPDGSRGAFRIFNSWGEQWGQQGKAWISYKDMDALIKNQGEAVTALEIINAKPRIITGVIK